MEYKDVALRYASRGWAVLPLHSFDEDCCTCGDKECGSPAKHPLTSNGVKDASTDPDVIRRWWEETEGLANVGIATGNGVMVVDVDARSGGFASLAALEERHGKIPPTPTVVTGGGGRHFYFRTPGGVGVGNRTAICPGIDIRAAGGYVVAPPSLHSSGQRYAWDVPEDTPIADAPPWLLDMLTNPSAGREPPSPIGNGRMVLRVEEPTLDFGTAPGVCEGHRHARLCQLVGVHLARSEDADAVEALALVWAARCVPPLGETEVTKTVASLAEKHRSTTVIAVDGDDIDAIPLPQSVPWPTLDAAALHGLSGEVVRLIAPETEADPVAILISTIVCVGNCVGRKVWFPVEGDRHHANIFACLVGETSRGRKGTSLGRTLMLWPEADAWKSGCIVNGLSSGEGLKWAVRDAVEATEPVKEKGKVVGYQAVIKDHGVADKRLLVVESEFSQALKVAQREGNTLSPVIRQAWDTGTLRTLTRNDPTVATDAHISVIGHITRQELVKDLSETDCSNGYANRFLWIAVKRSKMLPDGGDQIDLSPLGARLNHALAQVSGQMSRSPAARKLWHQWYPKLTADRPGLWGKVTSRAEAQTLRLSMIYALLDSTTVIDMPHLDAAIAIWNYAEASARLIFSEVEATDPLESVLLEKITASPGINRKSLHKALGGHVKAEAMVKALGSLAGQGKVRSEMVPTGGRRSECWWPVLTPSALPLTVESADEPPPDANERTKSDESAQADQSQDSSFVRKGDAHAGGGINGEPSNGKAHFDAISLSLAELFAEVQKLDGKIVRSAGGTFAIQGVERELLTPAVLSGLVDHRDELALMVPSGRDASAGVKPMTFQERQDAEWQKRYEAAQAERQAREAALREGEMSVEEWMNYLDEIVPTKMK